MTKSYRGYYSGWDEGDDIEAALEDLHSAHEQVADAANNLNAVSDIDLGLARHNDRAVALLNKAVDLRDGIQRFWKQVDKRFFKR
jgi:hypothetical protein